jgi:hypothetical protein
MTHRGLNTIQNALVTQDYYSEGGDKAPRYYQLLAINKTIEAIAHGQQRILLVMATGTRQDLHRLPRSSGGCGNLKRRSASSFSPTGYPDRSDQNQ